MAKTVGMVWHGLDEFRSQLMQTPKNCTNEAARIIEAGVNSAYVTISTKYGQHRYTGTLQDRLKIVPLRQQGELLTGLVLRSGSPLAWLFDNGSQARHHKSGKSTGAMWGRTPPTHIFARTVAQTKREIQTQIRDMQLRQLQDLQKAG